MAPTGMPVGRSVGAARQPSCPVDGEGAASAIQDRVMVRSMSDGVAPTWDGWSTTAGSVWKVSLLTGVCPAVSGCATAVWSKVVAACTSPLT